MAGHGGAGGPLRAGLPGGGGAGGHHRGDSEGRHHVRGQVTHNNRVSVVRRE